PSPPEREVRLYQASYLLRDYGFEMEELPCSQAGNLPLDRDAKLAWAELNLRDRPVELNQAHKQELLRVPGIGHKSADTILNARRQGKLREVNHLRQLGIKTKRMTPYILLDGQQPESELQQRRLFFL
ncbi:MAG: helix-hairpin-helix domain-containing protein, partial [Anaerolineales bacterium]|nr:helix-hairpin-helix domain-containing protein [Anaerolineales bacterium]